MHRVRSLLAERGLSHAEAVEMFTRRGVKTRQGTPLRPDYLSKLLRGHGASPQLARDIARAVREEFGVEIEPAELVASLAEPAAIAA
jgi:hypothetical protein